MKRVFITGVSAGIGHALASQYLERGYAVVGVSRRRPEDLLGNPHFHFCACDLTDLPSARPLLQQLLAQGQGQGEGFEVAYLNAGAFGEQPALAAQTPVQAFTAVLDINLVAVKWVLDVLLDAPQRPQTVCFSASVAGVRQRAGMLSYCVSKAALNALAKVYQLENPDVFFALLGLCNVDTLVSRTILGAHEQFVDLAGLRERARQPGYVVSPQQRARQIVTVLQQRQALNLESGSFQEIRPLLEHLNKEVHAS